MEPTVADMRRFLERKVAAREARPQRIVQWGSLLRSERFRPYSDIDVALEGVIEPVFHRISQYFENHLASDRWHANLLDRMVISIPGTRPSVLSEATRHALQHIESEPGI